MRLSLTVSIGSSPNCQKPNPITSPRTTVPISPLPDHTLSLQNLPHSPSLQNLPHLSFPFPKLRSLPPSYKNPRTTQHSVSIIPQQSTNPNLINHHFLKPFTRILMASLALKRAATTSSSLLTKLLNPTTPIRPSQLAPVTTRCFNTNAQMTRFDETDDSSLDVDQRDRSVSNRRMRPDVPSIFADVLDPFSPTRSLSQVLNMMDQFMDNPLLAASRGMGSGARRGWDVKEDNDGLYLHMDMPGLGKENVKVSVEQNTLVIKGEGEQENEDEESKRRYSSRIDLPPNLYKLDGIKAEMKNGVLKVVVPKVKEEERSDVHHVQIE